MGIEVEDLSPEDFMAEAGLSASKPIPQKKERAPKSAKTELLEGVVGEVEIKPEVVTQDTVRLMKVISITRKPEGKIAEIELRAKTGKLHNITIDEATARAVAGVFDT